MIEPSTPLIKHRCGLRHRKTNTHNAVRCLPRQDNLSHTSILQQPRRLGGQLQKAMYVWFHLLDHMDTARENGLKIAKTVGLER